MKQHVAQQLIELNRKFYQTFAESFSATRGRLQPGVVRALERLSSEANVLDLGCGNGQTALALASTVKDTVTNHRGRYLGLDFSEGLLAEAAKNLPDTFHAEFRQADLSTPDWDTGLSPASFEAILAFAVLHHLPGETLRTQTLRKVRALLAPGGQFIHSNWQFLNSPRLRARIRPWERIGLSESDVDEGDYLLDWRRDGEGLRYVHHFGEAELAELAEEAGFRVMETYLSDGEGGRLGLYGVWEGRNKPAL